VFHPPVIVMTASDAGLIRRHKPREKEGQFLQGDNAPLRLWLLTDNTDIFV
jgi:hypothetical protein